MAQPIEYVPDSTSGPGLEPLALHEPQQNSTEGGAVSPLSLSLSFKSRMESRPPVVPGIRAGLDPSLGTAYKRKTQLVLPRRWHSDISLSARLTSMRSRVQSLAPSVPE